MASSEGLLSGLNPLLFATNLAEIDTVLKLASSHPDRWGRCVIQSSVDETFKLDELTQKVRRLAPTNGQFATPLDRLCFVNIMFKVSKLIASSDQQYQEQRSCITRLFLSCFCCTCRPSKALRDLQKLNSQIIREYTQQRQTEAVEFAPDGDSAAVVLN